MIEDEKSLAFDENVHGTFKYHNVEMLQMEIMTKTNYLFP